jgi:signal transduction histidine kinase
VTRSADGGALLRQPVVVDGQSRLVQTRVPADQLREGVVRAWTVLAVLGLVLVALSLLVADRLARSITAPITDLARTTRRLGAGDLDARATPGGPDEVRAVGTAVNLLAARIRELLKSERESVADLSHRLRTPVTALRLDVEALPAGADRERLTSDVDELVRQVDALIVEARRPVREGVEPRCDARAVVDERVEFWRALAEDQGREVRVCLPAEPCPVRVGVADLEAALDALLGNVLAHTPDRVAFEVGLSADPAGGALLTVTDEGPGFADASVVARGRSGAGSTGLGLDIARRTATASGGSLQVERAPTRGARVLMRLGPPGAG